MPKKFSIVLSVLLYLLIFPVIFSSDTKAQGVDCIDWLQTQSSLPACANSGGNQECLQRGYDYCEDSVQGYPPHYYFRCCNNPPAPSPSPSPSPSPLPAQCTTDSDCSDNNPCTIDYCLGSGSPGSLCVHNNADAGTICQRDPNNFQPQLCCSASATCNVNCAPAPPPSCPAMTCSYSQTVSTSICESGTQIVTGTGCTGFNCGCQFVSGCSTTSCTQPSGPPPSDQCGSCSALTPACGETTAGADNCGNPCSKTGPVCAASCSVSWTLSNTNPPTNSTVTADVRGESITNATWTNVAYSLDGGGWNSSVQVTSSSIPTFRFSVPSGSANPHSLRFAIGNGSAVCTPLSSFITQAPPPAYYQVGGKVSNSTGNPLGNVCLSVYNDTNGQQTKNCNSVSSLLTNANGNWWIDSFIRGGDAFAVRAPGVPLTLGSTTYTNKTGDYENQSIFANKLDYNFTYTAPNAPPAVTLSANPPSITSGSQTTLSWDISGNAQSCAVANSGTPTITSGSWSGTLTGTEVSNGNHTRPITMTSTTSTAKTFNISCTNTNGTSPTSSTPVIVNPSGLPPAPTVSTARVTNSCINPNHSGSDVDIAWTNSGVSWVNISTDASFGSYYHKSVTGFSTTAPNGFYLNPSNPPQPLTLNPNTTYYVRTWNNTKHSAVASFSLPACSGGPGPTPPPGPPPPPPGGSTCQPSPPYQCTTSIGPGCTTSGITGQQHAWCRQFTGNNASICQSCPPPPPPPPSACEENAPVYPQNVTATVSGDDVTLSWSVKNSEGPIDQFQAYRSTQGGFTADMAKRIVSRLKPGGGTTHDLFGLYGLRSYFYKVTAFSRGGELAADDKQALARTSSMQCNILYGPPGSISNFSYNSIFPYTSGYFQWYYNSYFTNLHGWYLKKSSQPYRNCLASNDDNECTSWGPWITPEGMVIDITGQTESAMLSMGNVRVIYRMNPIIAGTYSVQAYGGCGGTLGGKSNQATVPQPQVCVRTESDGENDYCADWGPLPSPPPPNLNPYTVSASATTDSINASWTADSPYTQCLRWESDGENDYCVEWQAVDTFGAEGFHVYRSMEPLDLTKSVEADSVTINRQARFNNLAPGTYYFAVRVENNCGSGWSNIVRANLNPSTPSTCSGNIILTLVPNPTLPLTTITAASSGLISCTGKPITIRTPDCNGVLAASCTSGTSGCNANLVVPPTAGTYTYAACIDKTSPPDGDYTDPGESDTTTLTVNPPGSSANSAWIQTTGGDVHSNVRIYTPGGP